MARTAKSFKYFSQCFFSHEPVCGVVIKLAETLSGPGELLLVLARLQQHGLQLQLTNVARGKVKMTSVLIKAVQRNLGKVSQRNCKEDRVNRGVD